MPPKKTLEELQARHEKFKRTGLEQCVHCMQLIPFCECGINHTPADKMYETVEPTREEKIKKLNYFMRTVNKKTRYNGDRIIKDLMEGDIIGIMQKHEKTMQMLIKGLWTDQRKKFIAVMRLKDLPDTDRVVRMTANTALSKFIDFDWVDLFTYELDFLMYSFSLSDFNPYESPELKFIFKALDIICECVKDNPSNTNEELSSLYTGSSTCNVCCKTVETMKVCGACKQIRYCSRECQTADWNMHKQVCKQLAEKNKAKPSKK